jgi:Mg-chelatase subunit ChlD
MSEDSIPPEFLCPIMKVIMKDPVIMPDGQTYERSAIAEALNCIPISPITRQPLNILDAKTNFALKSLIEKYQNGDASMIHSVQQAIESIQKIRIDFSATKLLTDSQDLLHIFIKPEDHGSRPPLVLIAMIDVSGSMGEEACRSVSGLENLNLTRLQLVQHSLKTIIHTLTENDQIIFIEFDTHANLILEATRLNEQGKQRAKLVIDSLESKQSTNIWDALRIGIKQAQKFVNISKNVALLLFTDGEPNQNPPMGIIPTLEEELSDIDVNFTILTFSFGYHVDSILMEDIARIGHGVYGYCPDATMVGTIFINYLANMMNNLTQKALISIKNKKYQRKHEISLYSNKSQNILLQLPKGSIEGTEIIMTIPFTKQQFKIENINCIATKSQQDAMNDQIYRYKLINLIRSNLLNEYKALAEVRALFDEIKNLKNQTDFIKKIMIDLINPHPNHGQIEKAFQKHFYDKWGKDYLRSFLRFHELEFCGNFKDESLQSYITPQFAIIRKAGNKVFLSIPPPNPLQKQNQSVTRWTGNQRHQPYNMGAIYNYGGGCFDGNSIVKLNNGQKKVKDISKGDILFDGGVVVCLIETVQNSKQRAVEINETLFSPYHPIKHNGKWIFPVDICLEKKVYISSWFNIITSGNKVIRINETEAITLGHNMKDDILFHPYFGTDLVIESLKKHFGFIEGKIVISEPLSIKRDLNGLIYEYF